LFTRQPAFTATAVLTVALGIGANTAIFTLFDAMLLRSLPVRDPARLVLFNASAVAGAYMGAPPKGRWNLLSTEVYDYLRKQSLPFESLAAFDSGDDPVSVRFAGETADAGPARRAQVHLVSGSYFAVLGVPAALGRPLTDEDDRPTATPVAVLSDGFWRTRLHADASIVGQVATVNGTAFTIVGVAPPEFFGEQVRHPPDFWLPLAFQPLIQLRPSFLERADAYWLNLMGRLPPGVTRQQVQTATTAAVRQFLRHAAGAKLTPNRDREIQQSRVELEPGGAGISGLRQLYSEPLHILLAVVLLVLLIVCANVGNLLLSRGAARQAEMSVRVALGATRARPAQQLLTESLLLAGAGAMCAVILARWVVQALLALVVAPTSPIHAGATLNGSVLMFTAVIAVGAGLLFGLLPAARAGRVDVVTALKGGGRAASFRRRFAAGEILVAGQLAVSLVLLIGASVFARSLVNLEQQPLGFDDDHVLLARLNPRLGGYTTTDVHTLYRKLYDRVNALPGVRSATLASYSPLSASSSRSGAWIEGYTPKPDEHVTVESIYVGPSYPDALGVPLLEGRAIGVQDDRGAPLTAMVNEAFARHYFPNTPVVGHRFGPVNDPRPLRDQVASTFVTARLGARIVIFFGVLALVLSAVGLYGVVSQAVGHRTREIGVRLALGAERRDVLWLILRDTLVLTAVGLIVGVPAAFGAIRLVRSQLFGLGAGDPPSVGVAVVVLTTVAEVAGFLPARRASELDPMVALRYE
jgi:predicted permease